MSNFSKPEMIKKTISVYARLKKSTNREHPKIYSITRSEKSRTITFKTNENSHFGFYRNSTINFGFAEILDENSTQVQVFETVAVPVINNVLQGLNGTIFAYGQTGSGKTHTINGNANNYDDRGIIPRTIEYIYKCIENHHSGIYRIYISYMEIYNESAYDLLNPKHSSIDSENMPKVVLLEDEREVHLRNLNVVPVASEKGAMDLFIMGNNKRAIADTPMNCSSSRSHCIFTIHIANSTVDGGRVRAKLHLVDLAGSERVKNTKMNIKLFSNTRQINLSLHYLEQVILALSEGRKHIPYRNSTMTSVLKDSLGGNCYTVMVANFSIEAANFQETVSTCKFAQRVASISTEVFVNTVTDPQQEISTLKLEMENLRLQLEEYKDCKFKLQERLTEQEVEECKVTTLKFVDNIIPNIQTNGDTRKVELYFQLLRNIVHAKEKNLIQSLEFTKLKSNLDLLKNKLQEKEEEIAKLNFLLKENIKVQMKPSQYISSAPIKEKSHQYLTFENSLMRSIDFLSQSDKNASKESRCTRELESYVITLKQKFQDAQRIANAINTCKQNIVQIKMHFDLESNKNSEKAQIMLCHIKAQEHIYRTNILKLQQLKAEQSYLNNEYEHAKLRLLNSRNNYPSEDYAELVNYSVDNFAMPIEHDKISYLDINPVLYEKSTCNNSGIFKKEDFGCCSEFNREQSTEPSPIQNYSSDNPSCSKDENSPIEFDPQYIKNLLENTEFNLELNSEYISRIHNLPCNAPYHESNWEIDVANKVCSCETTEKMAESNKFCQEQTLNTTQNDVLVTLFQKGNQQRYELDDCLPEKLPSVKTKEAAPDKSKQTLIVCQATNEPINTVCIMQGAHRENTLMSQDNISIPNYIVKKDENSDKLDAALKDVPLTGDPEVDEEIITFYKAKFNIK